MVCNGPACLHPGAPDDSEAHDRMCAWPDKACACSFIRSVVSCGSRMQASWYNCAIVILRNCGNLAHILTRYPTAIRALPVRCHHLLTVAPQLKGIDPGRTPPRCCRTYGRRPCPHKHSQSWPAGTTEVKHPPCSLDGEDQGPALTVCHCTALLFSLPCARRLTSGSTLLGMVSSG